MQCQLCKLRFCWDCLQPTTDGHLMCKAPGGQVGNLALSLGIPTGYAVFVYCLARVPRALMLVRGVAGVSLVGFLTSLGGIGAERLAAAVMRCYTRRDFERLSRTRALMACSRRRGNGNERRAASSSQTTARTTATRSNDETSTTTTATTAARQEHEHYLVLKEKQVVRQGTLQMCHRIGSGVILGLLAKALLPANGSGRTYFRYTVDFGIATSIAAIGLCFSVPLVQLFQDVCDNNPARR